MANIDERTRFTFRIPDPLMAKIKQEADRLGVSTNALILQILWSWEGQGAPLPTIKVDSGGVQFENGSGDSRV